MKKFVDVIAKFDTEGNVIPLKIRYDEEPFMIDKITDIRPAASLKAGGVGIRYTCYIYGKLTYLFLDDGKWFVE